MAASQLVVVALLIRWDMIYYGLAVAVLVCIQMLCMGRFLRDPVRFAVWYSAIGVGLYVTGMMITAFALRALGAT